MDAEAESAYRRSLALEPGRVIAANNLAMLLVAGGRPEGLAEAASLSDVLLGAASDDAVPAETRASLLDTAATVAAARGDLDRAAGLLRQSVELAPEVAEWRVHLAEVLAGAGEREAARDALSSARRLLRGGAGPLRDRAVAVAARLDAGGNSP